MEKATVRRALEGNRNRRIKDLLIEILEGAEFDGIIVINKNLREDQKGIAYVVANWDDYENCNALITHDLHSFHCWNLPELISKLRLN